MGGSSFQLTYPVVGAVAAALALLCFGGGIGIRGCLKSNCPKGRGGSIPSQSTNRNWFFLSSDMGFKTQILKPMSMPK